MTASENSKPRGLGGTSKTSLSRLCHLKCDNHLVPEGTCTKIAYSRTMHGAPITARLTGIRAFLNKERHCRKIGTRIGKLNMSRSSSRWNARSTGREAAKLHGLFTGFACAC